MTTLESEIYRLTGVSISNIPPDGRSRKFIAGPDEWYALSLGNCGSFGCFGRRSLYGWDGGHAYPIRCQDESNAITPDQLRVEKEIVWFGNLVQDEGAQLSDDDNLRYIESLRRVIDSRRGRDG